MTFEITEKNLQEDRYAMIKLQLKNLIKLIL